MLTQVRQQDLPSYQIGREDGLAQGREEGRQRAEIDMLRRMLQLRFGALPERREQQIEGSTAGQRAPWFERLMTSQGLDEVFRDG